MPEIARAELREPLFLLLIVLAPVVYALAARLPASVTYSSLSLVDRAPGSWRTRIARLPPLLLAFAVVALAIALAGPRTGDSTTRLKQEGIAIAIAVDRSGSMQARDFLRGDASMSRLDLVKLVFRRFVVGGDGSPGRPDDLIGLVAFARYADGLCPLTLDHGNLLAILNQIEIPTDLQEDGTAIGEGLALAVERLRRQEAQSKVVVLLTDGVNNAGDIDPLQASDLARQYGIKVYTIGAGTMGRAPLAGQVGNTRNLLPTLQTIAERTGGQHFHATDAEGLTQVMNEIDALERSELIEIRYLEYEHHFEGFVVAALGFIASASLLSGTLLRRLP